MNGETKKLLLINTHMGLFQYSRLPFGVSSAPAIFQENMSRMVAGLPRAVPYLDNILISTRSQTEHLERLCQVCTRLSRFEFRVRKEKCSFATSSVSYLGFIVNSKGVRPHSEKITVIQYIPVPSNVSFVRAYLGFVNHYAKFKPQLYDLRASLERLLQKNVPFVWSDKCQGSFQHIKRILMFSLSLTHFLPDEPLVLLSDASSTGVGAVLFHRFAKGTAKVIANASKSLTPAERNYLQIEREALSIVFEVKKFHQCLWGREFTIPTDHQPLTTIFGPEKGVPLLAASRLQR